ncbi:hypothetical protein Nepgr_005313 [Nepenthes gracilis]|uniref:Uncharacterized protein n=1 Tax=Nepenthes gracilis TaxID=150966 RepID=A0AAD3S3F8_NEPGR|nr:hypothetical protein Nepgr_005313 [Nepenthes gracilis]
MDSCFHPVCFGIKVCPGGAENAAETSADAALCVAVNVPIKPAVGFLNLQLVADGNFAADAVMIYMWVSALLLMHGQLNGIEAGFSFL